MVGQARVYRTTKRVSHRRAANRRAAAFGGQAALSANDYALASSLMVGFFGAVWFADEPTARIYKNSCVVARARHPQERS